MQHQLWSIDLCHKVKNGRVQNPQLGQFPHIKHNSQLPSWGGFLCSMMSPYVMGHWSTSNLNTIHSLLFKQIFIAWSNLNVSCNLTDNFKIEREEKRNKIEQYLNHIVQSNLVNTTIVYTTPSILQHNFARPKFFSSKLPLLYDYDTR